MEMTLHELKAFIQTMPEGTIVVIETSEEGGEDDV